MAQIDLKNVVIKIKDGYGPTGFRVNKTRAGFLVANMGGYMAADTTMLVDGGIAALATGDTFTVAGETATPKHVITSHIETLGVTTSITFTPALASSVADDAAITVYAYSIGATTMLVDTGTAGLVVGDLFTVAGDTPRHTITSRVNTLGVTTSITFTPALAAAVLDNAVITMLPHELQLKIGEGNLTYSEKRKIKYVTDRGLLDTVRLDNQEPVDVKLDITWEYLTASQGGDPPTMEDALKQRGNASTWVSSATDPCEVYAVDLELTNTPPCNDVPTEVIIMPDFRWEDLQHDPKTAQISVTGKCNVLEALVSRV